MARISIVVPVELQDFDRSASVASRIVDAIRGCDGVSACGEPMICTDGDAQTSIDSQRVEKKLSNREIFEERPKY